MEYLDIRDPPVDNPGNCRWPLIRYCHVEPTPHPLLAAVRVCADAFDEIAEVAPIYADGATREALLVELTRLSARVSAVRAQVLAVSDDLADRLGARNTAAVLAVATRTSRREAILDERLGEALRARWTQVGQAATTGAVTWNRPGFCCARSTTTGPTTSVAERTASPTATSASPAGREVWSSGIPTTGVPQPSPSARGRPHEPSCR